MPHSTSISVHRRIASSPEQCETTGASATHEDISTTNRSHDCDAKHQHGVNACSIMPEMARYDPMWPHAGIVLAMHRIQTGMSITTLAGRIGASEDTIRNIESGMEKCKHIMWQRLTRELS